VCVYTSILYVDKFTAGKSDRTIRRERYRSDLFLEKRENSDWFDD